MRELLRITIGEAVFGIWKDTVQSIHPLAALHRIPLCPEHIAGIMIDGGDTLTLGDLPVCIGYPAPPLAAGFILTCGGDSERFGFVAPGSPDILPVSPGHILPLPASLQSTLFRECILGGNRPIPVIEIDGLHARLAQPGSRHGAPPRAAAPTKKENIGHLLQVAIGGEQYAVPANSTGRDAEEHGPIAPLPGAPRFVRGITLRQGRLLPAVSLAQRLKQTTETEHRLLVTDISGEPFGFLVDSESGELDRNESVILELPLLVQTPWLKHAVLHGDAPIPLIDLQHAIASDPESTGRYPARKSHRQDSSFPSQFFNETVTVTEFSLLSERYALPKGEVEDIIACKPWRTLPEVPLVVVGVAEHEGDILPVMDLAIMFGRHSLVTSSWRMLVVRNGDFRALVLTDAVAGDKTLPTETHRAVPLHLPHNLMYGCYPDGIAARIILNAAAIAMHFDRSLQQQFIPTHAQEALSSPTAVAYTASKSAIASKPPAATTHFLPPQPQHDSPEAARIDTPVSADVMTQATSQMETDEVPSDPAMSDRPHAQQSDMTLSAPLSSALEPTPLSSAIEAGAGASTSAPSDDAMPVSQASDATNGPASLPHRQADRKSSPPYFVLLALTALLLVLVAGYSYTNKAREPEASITTAPVVAPEPAPKTASPQPATTPEPQPALELEVPANIVVEFDVYVVKQGDTLWTISQRFTGNPHNYPRIAGSNRIANPNLIFPGQRIRLVRK